MAVLRALFQRLPIVLLVAFHTVTTAGATPAKRSYSTHDYYVLQLDRSAPASIHDCAGALGVEVVEQVGHLRDHWLVRVPSSSLYDESERRSDLDSSSSVDIILERFQEIRSVASSYLSSPSLVSRSLRDGQRISRSIRSLERQVPRQRIKKRVPIPELPSSPSSPPEYPRAPVPPGGKSQRIAQALGIIDPIFNDQWHLANNPRPNFDLNVSGVWESGIRGKGVCVAVVDDGLDLNSDDLHANFYAEGSWDYNDHTALPLPRLSDDQHGTRCSGEIAAVKNDVCGVGVAYESKIAGIRILSGPISDADEAAALNYGYNVTSIYSCSWGPPDDGRSMEAPGLLIKKAVLNGIQNGRDGKGSIFVFASGNGAGSGDQCNFDGYTNSIYSVTVAAVDHMGKHPYYSESCAANLIVAYSSGGGNRIHTTDVGKNKCTSSHGGTSAAAPLGAGVIALGLQARPELTWRDVQHICVRTAQHINPQDPDWEMTTSGRPYSYKYGYGSLDAWTFVELAKTWKLVKKQAWVDLPQIELNNPAISAGGDMTGGEFIVPGGVKSTVNVNATYLTQNNFETLEHITVKVWISHAKRGDVEVDIVSPNGVRSVLAGARRFDEHTTGYPGWQFMSVKHWGESSLGDWTLTVKDQAHPHRNGSFLGWSLTLWGECVDDSKAKLWTFPEDKEPPAEIVTSVTLAHSATPSPTVPTDIESTKTARPKPTDGLPDDHDIAHGDTENPAFPNPNPSSSSSIAASLPSPSESAAPSPSSMPSVTPDEGYFHHFTDLLNSSTWLIVAIALAALFVLAGGLFFWRRRVQRMAEYSAVNIEDGGMAMGAVDGSSRRLLGGGNKGRGGSGGRSKELYDAFGEPSDDEEDEEDDPRKQGDSSEHVGLRYHDDFLEDDQLDSAAHSPRIGGARYRDDDDGLPPREEHEKSALLSTDEKGNISEGSGGARSVSPSGGSGDSWEHASTDPGR